MEMWNRLTAARGEDGGVNGGKKGKGLVKEPLWMTHRHGQWCGDWLWEPGMSWTEEAKGGKLGQL